MADGSYSLGWLVDQGNRIDTSLSVASQLKLRLVQVLGCFVHAPVGEREIVKLDEDRTSESDVQEFFASAEEAGERIDKWLVSKLPNLSRSRIQALVRDGAVSSRGRSLSNPGEKIKGDETYRIVVPDVVPEVPQAQPIALNIVYEDPHLIVVDKPAGLVVHPGAGHLSGTLVNALIAHCGESLSAVGGAERQGIVHRLDKDTSGLLVIAKDDVTHHGLAEQFVSHGLDGRLHRAYIALSWGEPDRRRGQIEANLGRSPQNRTKMTVVGPEEGRHAVTHYEVVRTFDAPQAVKLVSLLRLVLETGRTHQIRVHLAHIRHPVLGDPVYGSGFKASARRLGPLARSALERLGRQALHAAELAFEHPVTGQRLSFESPLPDDMVRLVESLEAGN